MDEGAADTDDHKMKGGKRENEGNKQNKHENKRYVFGRV